MQRQQKQPPAALLSRLAEHSGAALAAALLAAAAASIVLFTALGIFASQETADRDLQASLQIQNCLETLLALHTAANTDFLKGVGTVSYGSHAWPVTRASQAAAVYTRIEDAMAGDPKNQAAIVALRQLSAKWSLQLENAAQHTIQSGSRVAIDSNELLNANSSFREIADKLSAMRTQQEVRVAKMQAASERRLAHERGALCLATVAAASFLAYGFLASHRASLARTRATIVAAEAESRFREYFEEHPLAMMIYDTTSLRVLTANAAAQRQYGYSRERFLGLSFCDLRPESDVSAFRSDLETYLHASPRSGSAGIRRHLRADGTVIYVDVSFHFLSYAGHEACFITAIEVTEHEAAKLELRLRGRALDSTLDAVLITEPVDDGDVVIYANPAFERITGYARSEIIGSDCRFLLGHEDDDPAAATIREALRTNTEGAALLRSYRRDGSLFWNRLHVAPVFDDNGTVTHHISVFSDASDLVHSQERLRQQARQDALTLLPNRFSLGVTLRQMLVRAHEESERIALVFVDLDNFKDVNDTLGHSAGDEVLQTVANRLSTGLRNGDFVARYGGDEFVILLYGTREADSVESTLAQLNASICAPFTVAGFPLHIESSMGIAWYPEDGSDAETLLRNADTALYRAKSEGRNRTRRFEPALARASADRLALAARLRRALELSEFELHYQPKVSVKEGRVTGLEALLRWRDPELGLVNPGEFIPQAEASGLIVPIGEWILERACLQARQISSERAGMRVSVNVSPVQFSRGDLPATVARALQRSRLDPRLLEVEITENALVEPATLPLLHAIRAMGVAVAIDDFGVGYSSLAYARHFTADTLKIDTSFVNGIGRCIQDEAIVKAILGLGHTLGMKVVAEGVETVEQRDFLARHRCDEIQGYLYGRPLPAVEISELIEAIEADVALEQKPL